MAALFTTSFSRGDEADGFLATVAPFGVNDEQDEQRIPGHADFMAAFLARDDTIQVVQAKGVIEDAGGKLERDPVLGDIGAILLLVPFKDHRIYSLPVYTANRLT